MIHNHTFKYIDLLKKKYFTHLLTTGSFASLSFLKIYLHLYTFKLPLASGPIESPHVGLKAAVSPFAQKTIEDWTRLDPGINKVVCGIQHWLRSCSSLAHTQPLITC